MLDVEQLKMKVAELQESIEKQLPGYAVLLATIHKETAQQPELLYKLDDSEIATLIAGMGVLHKVEIVTPKDKKKISKKVGNQMSEDDV